MSLDTEMIEIPISFTILDTINFLVKSAFQKENVDWDTNTMPIIPSITKVFDSHRKQIKK